MGRTECSLVWMLMAHQNLDSGDFMSLKDDVREFLLRGNVGDDSQVM